MIWNLSATMSDAEPVDESHTPPRRRSRRREKRRRSSSSSTSSSSTPEERTRRRSRKHPKGLTTEDVMNILTHWKAEPSKSTNSLQNSQLYNVIPEFDPANRSQSIEAWIRKVNECSQIYSWDQKQTIHFSLQKLVGLAKKWFESLPTVVFSWNEWQVKLKRAFPSEENYGRLLEEMLARTTRGDESLREYFYDKLNLLNRCEIKGKRAVDCVIHGITDRSVRSGAQALNCEEPEDLLNFLCAQRITYFSNKDRSRQRSNSSAVTNNSGNNDGSIVCFNCRNKGHPYHKCPKPVIKCKKCNRIGHDNENCKLRPVAENYVPRSKIDDTRSTAEKNTLKIVAFNDQMSPKPVDTSNTPTSITASNDKFFKTVFVNGQPFVAYIDFGSECSLLRASLALELQLTQDSGSVPVIRGFGNSCISPLCKSRVNLKLDDIETQLDVLVVGDEFMTSSLLIGQNFTELPFITVLKDCHQLVFYRTPEENLFPTEVIVKMYTLKPMTVENTSMIPITVADASFSGDVFVEGYNSLEPGREFRLLQGTYGISNGTGEIAIANLSRTPLSFKSETLIARSLPVTEAKNCRVNRISENSTLSLEPLERTNIQIGEDLISSDKNRLYTLLQKYRDCFATNMKEVGCVKDFEMKINLTDNRPVVYRPYRLSFSERLQVREIVDELLDTDIIQESSSDYASPILMVRKKSGEQRLCVDFRALNNKTIKDRFPLPLIEDQLINLSGNQFFTTLDLASGYYQIPMSRESRHLTGFITPDGHYEFKRMPFGLANAPAVFQRMINKILGNRRFDYALAYLDDLLIPSVTIEQGFERLEEILKLLREFGLTLKLTKCRFFDMTISYLGYEISAKGVKPGEAKVLAVKEFPCPCSIHEVRQFLGLTGYFRKFIKGYGEIAQPLTNLLKKNVAWHWGSDQQTAFNSLKESLLTRQVLALYDPQLETELHTDASALGIGGILMQWQASPRVLKPVAYFSRQTTVDEKHFHSYELETLAVVCSLKKFRVYLLGVPFKVFTDCAALRTTLTKRDLVPRIARWWLQIIEFNFEIEYRPGVNMAHVDALSRNTRLNAEGDVGSVSVLNIESGNWLLTLQMGDPETSRIIKVLKPEADPELVDIRQKYTVKNNALYRKVDDRLCLVVPRSARWQVCRANHDDIGHLGYAKTLERIKSQFWFAKLRRYVKKYVGSCIECAYSKDSATKKKQGLLFPIEKISVPFHTIHIDHLGPFVRSRNGNSYILTIVDGFTKYVFVRAVKDTKTKSTIKILESIFTDFGTPARIISDRGTSFTSTAFESFCSGLGIKHVLNAVACPRANGQAERFNQTILNSLSAQNLNKNERDWDKCLGKVQWGINNTVNATTQKTATEALFGLKMRDSLSNKFNVPPQSQNEDLLSLRENISVSIKKSQEEQKRKHDLGRTSAPTYQVGDLVKLTRTNYNNDGKSTKLLSKFIGPYKIVEVLGNDRYRISDVPGFNRKRNNSYESVISTDRIRPWIHLKALELDDNVDISSGEETSS